MDFLKWGAKKGSTGATVRTIFRQYQITKQENPNSSEEDILYAIFINRFKKHPLSEREKRRVVAFVDREGTGDSVKFLNLAELCSAIIEIETGITHSDYKQYSIMTEVIEEELERLNPNNS